MLTRYLCYKKTPPAKADGAVLVWDYSVGVLNKMLDATYLECHERRLSQPAT